MQNNDSYSHTCSPLLQTGAGDHHVAQTVFSTDYVIAALAEPHSVQLSTQMNMNIKNLKKCVKMCSHQ